MEMKLQCCDGTLEFPTKYLRANSLLIDDYITDTRAHIITVPLTVKQVQVFVDFTSTLLFPQDSVEDLLCAAEYLLMAPRYGDILDKQMRVFLESKDTPVYTKVKYTLHEYRIKLQSKALLPVEKEALLPRIKELYDFLENARWKIRNEQDRVYIFAVKDCSTGSHSRYVRFPKGTSSTQAIELVEKTKSGSQQEFIDVMLASPTYLYTVGNTSSNH